MRYQSTYLWLVFLSALDIMFTWIVLFRGGREINIFADAIIRRFGLSGLVAFKFSIIVGVILVCEAVGRRTDNAGWRLAQWSVAISAIPVTLALLQLLAFA